MYPNRCSGDRPSIRGWACRLRLTYLRLRVCVCVCGWGSFWPQHMVFRECWENVGAQRCPFWHASSCINFAPFQKISAQGRLRSGHVTLSQKYSWLPVTAVIKVSIWNLQELIKALVPTKRISRNFDGCDLSSGHFWDLTIMAKWEMCKCRFFPKVRVIPCCLSQLSLILGHSRWPVCSFDPMTFPSGHSRSYVRFAFCL